MRKDTYEPLLDHHLGIEREGTSRTPPGRVTLTMQLAAPLQRKESAVGASAPAARPPASDDPQVAAWPLVVEDDPRAIAARGVAGSGESLPYLDDLKRSFGRHAGALDGVRAHTGASAAAAATAIGADAYATGRDIALAAPPTRALVAHEAAHVVQQHAGVALSGGVGEAGDVYERNADAVGAAFAAGQPVEALLDELAGAGGGGGAAVQRKAHGHGDSGVRSDERMGEGAKQDIHTTVTARKPLGPAQTELTFASGRKQGVQQGVGMPGFLRGDAGVLATFEIDFAGETSSTAVVPLAARYLETHAFEVVINPAGGVPPAPKLPHDHATHVNNVQVEGDRKTRVFFAGGATIGVREGMHGVLFDPGGRSLGGFTIDRVNPTGCSALVEHTPDTVAHATAKLNTAGAVA